MEGIEQALTAQARTALMRWQLPDQQPHLIKYRENAVFRVTLADGGLAALRLHRAGYHSQQALASELAWMADLRRRGVSAPAPIPTAEGAWLARLDHGQAGPRYADLIGWVEGEPLGASGLPLQRTPAELAVIFDAVGGEMARLHDAGDHFARPADFVRPAWNGDGLLGDAPFWGRFWDCPGIERTDRDFLVALRERLRAELARVEGGLDYGLIHADLVRENIMIDGGRVAFIDFDDCGLGFRLFDLATALLRNRGEACYPAIRQSLLDGYLAVRPAMRAQIGYLPLFLLLRALTYIGWAGARPELPDSAARLQRYILDARRIAADFAPV
jgi:Ser/Thr protein kinase RdoA (MazF antagonist)